MKSSIRSSSLWAIGDSSPYSEPESSSQPSASTKVLQLGLLPLPLNGEVTTTIRVVGPPIVALVVSDRVNVSKNGVIPSEENGYNDWRGKMEARKTSKVPDLSPSSSGDDRGVMFVGVAC